jgi:hypothetical protein
VNASHQIFLNWRYDMKNFLSWHVACDEASRHRIVLLQNGVVALTCEIEESLKIIFFNFRGKELATLSIKGRIVKLFPITTKLAETFLVITKITREVEIINATDFSICAVLEQRPYPELVAAIEDSRRLLIVDEFKKGQGCVENRMAVVNF